MKAKLIKGSELNPEQVKEVKSAFGYRWTIQNENRARQWMRSTSAPTIAPIDDEEWLKEHAFYIRKNGGLASTPRHCEPVYMAE